jgi:flagellin
MPSVLNTNIASLFAAKNLESAQSRMANSVERLSSGMRINRAKDDAAGLGISQSLTSQINGANQGIRNVNDGISIVQTAEGAINSAQEMGQRILALATQASNGSLSTENRKAIQSEMSVLLTGIGAISTRTKFGDKVLLNASTTEAVDNKDVARYKIQVSNDANDIISLTNDAFRTLGTGTTAQTETSTFTFNSDLIAGQSVTIGGATITATGGTVTKETMAELFAGNITANTTSGNAVVTVATSKWDAGTATATTFHASTYVTGSATLVATYNTINTSVTDLVYSSVGSVNFSVSTLQGSAAGTGQSSLLSDAVTTLGTHLLVDPPVEATILSDLSTIQSEASNFLLALNKQRSKLGALQNQMESSVNNVQELSANLSSARSRVQDTDYATETAALTKGQILQQAATAMLAQANQMPNVILSLLK